MSKKIIQFIVIFLAVLIIICFVALILGMYLKITGNQNNSQHNIKDFSLGLSNNEKIGRRQSPKDGAYGKNVGSKCDVDS